MIDKLGLEGTRVVECIVTTWNPDGTPNAAPIGLRRGDEGDITVRVHKGSDTCANILREGVFCANIILDPYLFLKTALTGHGGRGQELPRGDYNVCAMINAPCLKGAAATIELRMTGKKEMLKQDKIGETKFYSINGEILKVNIIDSIPKGYNRGLGAAVELAIELSRGNKKNIPKYLSIMEKTLENSEFNKIKRFIKSFMS
jgi:hypothetical protein